MIDYTKLFNNASTETETKSFIDGCQKLSSEDLIRVGKGLHIIDVNQWKYNDNICYSVKFKEYPRYYYNASKPLAMFIERLIEACGCIENARNELIENPPCLKFKKVKTKSGFYCTAFDLIEDEIAPF